MLNFLGLRCSVSVNDNVINYFWDSSAFTSYNNQRTPHMFRNFTFNLGCRLIQSSTATDVYIHPVLSSTKISIHNILKIKLNELKPEI